MAGTVTLDGVTRTTEVRGRGNSSWSWAKKPYKLKLEEDAALVGDIEHDEWVLLANYGDRSGLRTATAFAIAAQTRLAWTPKFRFVDVVLNGQSQGLYMLTEQVEAGRRLASTSPTTATCSSSTSATCATASRASAPSAAPSIAFKDPDEVTKRQRREVRRAVSRFERVLYGPDFDDPKEGYRAYVDVRRIIDWYLVEELFANQDSNFQSSVNFSWVPGKRFVFGPVWDFDLSAGTKWKGSTSPRTSGTPAPATHWISRMLAGPRVLRAREEALAGPATGRRPGPRPGARRRRPRWRRRPRPTGGSGTPTTPTSSGPATPAPATARWRSWPTG